MYIIDRCCTGNLDITGHYGGRQVKGTAMRENPLISNIRLFECLAAAGSKSRTRGPRRILFTRVLIWALEETGRSSNETSICSSARWFNPKGSLFSTTSSAGRHHLEYQYHNSNHYQSFSPDRRSFFKSLVPWLFQEFPRAYIIHPSTPYNRFFEF